MKTLLALLLLIPSLSFSESIQVKIEDSFYSSTECNELEENYISCSKDGISFYGMFVDGFQEGIGVYKQVDNDIIYYFVAEHQNGKVTGDGKTIIKIDDDWSREFILSYSEYDYPNDLIKMLSNPSESLFSSGVFHDTLLDYYIFGRFDYTKFFLEDNYYLFMYLDGYLADIPLGSHPGCIYTAKIDLNSLKESTITPKDGLASIACSDRNSQIKNKYSRYIGSIKNMLEDGKGFKELNYTKRPPDTLDVPPLEYFENINNPLRYEIGDFSEGKLISKNIDFLKNSEQYINLDKEIYSSGFYLFMGEEKLKFNEKYNDILSDLEGYIDLFYQ